MLDVFSEFGDTHIIREVIHRDSSLIPHIVVY
ncbi:MAG: hypothetical protein UV70_C0002G0061 [Parcubacteria group bacterium GW2011_GWA2_43_13]|nr:MAG: hypothetical protein UV70_C0002G0061 [Parcubacteria group bacterium GW2011_GWA2_43_13]